MFAPDISDPNSFTIFSEKMSANPGEAYIFSFTANNRRSFVVVNYGDELKFSCNASGTIPTHGYLYFKKFLKDSPMKLLTTGKLTEQLKLKLDYVTLDDEGTYTCQPGYEAESSISISVKVEQFNQNDDSDFQTKDWDNRNDGSENQNENCCLPRNIIILTISLSIGGLAIITGIIVFAVFEVRLRRRVRRARVGNNNNNIALSVPLVHVAEEVLARCNDQESCLQVSPPPYDLVCNKDDLQDVLPPPYHDVVLSSISQTDTHCNPTQQQQRQSLDVKFDEPSVKYAKLGSKTSMTCYIYGDPKDVTTIYRTIQIVKVLDESSEEILTEGKNVLSGDNYKIDINPSSFPPYKYHIILTILSAKINDDRQFICRFTDLDGDVHESRIRLQVVKTPDQLICRKKNVYSKLQVTCSAVVYPQGRCDVISSNDGSSLSSSIAYNHFKDADNLFTTTCSIDVSKSYVIKITFAPDVANPTNFTLHSNSISEKDPSVAFIFSFTANDEYYSVSVDTDDDLEFSCQARGKIPTQIYLFREKGVFMKLLASGSSSERLQFEIDNVTPDDEGVYTCQVGYDATSSKSIDVKVKSGEPGGSDYHDDDNEGYYVSRNVIIITISFSICGLVLIVGIIAFMILWVRRRRKARSTRAGNSGIVLSMPSAPVPDDVLIRCNEYETCFQMSPPPYAIACNKDDMPPSYPDVVLNSGSQMEEHSSQGTQLGSPPPYSVK